MHQSRLPEGTDELSVVRAFPCDAGLLIVVTSIGDHEGSIRRALWALRRWDEERRYWRSLATDDDAPEPEDFDPLSMIVSKPAITAEWRAHDSSVLVEISVEGALYANGEKDPDCDLVVGWTPEIGCPASELNGRDVILLLLPTEEEVITAPDPGCDPGNDQRFVHGVVLTLPCAD